MNPPVRDEVDALPLGVRVTIAFLRIFGAVMYLPVVVAALGTMMTLVASGDYLFSVVLFGAFLTMLMIASGCHWLAHHLKATVMSEWNARVQRPGHPLRHIFIPPLGCVMAYSFFAFVVWFSSIANVPPSQSWPWPAAWIAIGFGATYLFHLIDTKLP